MLGRGRAGLLALAVVLAAAACTLERTPSGLGPPFLEVVGWTRVADLRATTPPSWSPTAPRLAFATHEGIWVAGLSGEPRRVAALPGVTRVAWRRGGSSVLALAGGRLLDVPVGDAGTATQVVATGVRAFAEAPDGRRIALVTVEGGRDAVRLVGPGSGGRLGQAVAIPPGWGVRGLTWATSRDLLLALGRGPSGFAERVARLTLGSPRPLHLQAWISLGRPTPRLEVSPGARFLAYVVPPPPGGDGGQSVAVQRQDGTGRRILGPPGRILGLAWSPSGTVLALARRRGQDRASLELVDVTTGLGAPVGEYRPETSPTAGPVSLAWAPSGRALAVGPGPGQPPDPVWVVLLRRR